MSWPSGESTLKLCRFLCVIIEPEAGLPFAALGGLCALAPFVGACALHQQTLTHAAEACARALCASFAPS